MGQQQEAANASQLMNEEEEAKTIPWTREQVMAFRLAEPSVSVWRVVSYQLLVGSLLTFVVWLFGAKASNVISLGYGALCVVLPSAVFARGITSKWSSLNPGAAVTGFFLWEVVKVFMTIVMLLMSQSWVDGLSWPMMLLGLIITMKVYWFSFLWGRKGK